MIGEVRVLTPEGHLKKVISPKQLKKNFWKKFNEQSDFSLSPSFKVCEVCQINFACLDGRRKTCSEICAKQKAYEYQQNRYHSGKDKTKNCQVCKKQFTYKHAKELVCPSIQCKKAKRAENNRKLRAKKRGRDE